MNIEQLQVNLRTAVNAICWGARRTTPWRESADPAGDWVFAAATFSVEGVEFPIAATVCRHDVLKPYVAVIWGSRGVRIYTEHRSVGLLNVACIATALLKCAKNVWTQVPDYVTLYNKYHCEHPGFDSEPQQRACSDCAHFQYLHLNPYCNEHCRVTAHDKYCKDFTPLPPKPLTPRN